MHSRRSQEHPPQSSRIAVRAGLVLAFSISVVIAWSLEDSVESSSRAPSLALAASTSVERGRYLVSIMGCHDCHTPFKMGARGPEPDMSRMLSGHPQGLDMPPAPRLEKGAWGWVGAATNTAYAGPWGVSYTANLTPDEATGLGIWTEDMFVRAIRTGKHFGEPTSRDIMPPMPWPVYRNTTDDDLKAIYAYLRTIPPVRNHVPDYQPPASHGE